MQIVVFIGKRGVMRTPARGRFHCPHCGASRAYAYRRIRRFFVVLFVPVVPLDGEVEFVQCGFCRRAFNPTILEEAEARCATMEVDAETQRRVDEALTGAAASRLLVWEVEGE